MGWGTRRKPGRLAEKLLRIRTALDLSQDDIVVFLGITGQFSRSKISEYERGEREPDLLLLLKYARAAGVWMDVLVDDELDLPEELPASQRKGVSGRAGRKTPVSTTTVMLRLHIESKSKSARSEKSVRKNIETSYLQRYGVKKLKDGGYEFEFSYKDGEDLDKQVYGLLQAIVDEADARGCVLKFDAKEKDTDKYW